MKNIRLLIMLALGALVRYAPATEGINLIGIGPVQQGTAGAGVAAAKDSTWLILNPAGLTDLAPRVDASFQLFAPVRSIDSGASGGAGEQSDHTPFFIPSISTALGCRDGSCGYFGFGLYGTSGMGVKYDAGRIGAGFPPATPQALGDTRTELAIAKLAATYAYRFGDSGFSLGISPLLVISRLRTDMLNPNTFAYSSDEWDNALGGGAVLGFNQHLGRLSLGGSYTTEQWMERFDEYDALLGGSLNLPQQLTLGAAYRIRPNLELALDYRWIGWSELDTLGEVFGWDDQHIVKAGATWALNESWTLRGGVSHGQAPIDRDTAFGNALFPAVAETHLTTGISYTRDRWDLHLAYVHALENSITASGADAGMLAPLAAGTEITMVQNSLTAGLSLRF